VSATATPERTTAAAVPVASNVCAQCGDDKRANVRFCSKACSIKAYAETSIFAGLVRGEAAARRRYYADHNDELRRLRMNGAI